MRLMGIRGGHHPFRVLRWIALAYVVVWVPVYAVYWDWQHFLYLCNVAVVLTAVGLWFADPLLLSSQAVGSLVIGTIWGLDLAWGAMNHGSGLTGGTEYMWDAASPLWVRMFSFDHLAVPVAALWGVWKIGYDRRAWIFQSGVAAVVLVAGRIIAPGHNLNFVEKELVTSHTWGPAPVHVAFIWTVLVFLVYWPVHAMLARLAPQRRGETRVAARDVAR
jgi:hypothetical protein